MKTLSIHNSYIMSIGAGKNQLPLINAIKAYGYKVISCDNNPDAEGKYASDIFLNISSHDDKALVDRLQQLDIELVAVLTRSTGIPVQTCAKVAQAYKLPGMNVELSQTLIHKERLMVKCNQLGIPAPQLFTTEQLDNIPLPVFVKPAFTAVSHAAMSTCHDHEQLKTAIADASHVSVDGSVNVEEYLLGADVGSIDFVFNGEVHHVMTLGELSTGAPHFDGIGWYTPDSSLDSIIQATFSKFHQQLNVQHGFFQTAMKYDDVQKTAKIYEIHAEIGGDLVNDVFLPYVTDGYDIFENNISLSLNQLPKPCKGVTKPAMIIFKEKINHYALSISVPESAIKVDNDQYLIIEFDSQQALSQYLTCLTQQENISITNRDTSI